MNSPLLIAQIGLGSNLGHRARTLDDAVAALAETPGVTLLAVSSFHETNPTGGPEGQGAYLNAAATVSTTLDPPDLLRVLQRIEAKAGRVRRERWGARTLDLDLLLAGPLCLRTSELSLPHPLMAVRRFVLTPLAEIAPDAVHPTTGRTVADLLVNLDRRPSRLLVDDADDHRRAEVVARLVAVLDPGSWIVSEAFPSGFDHATLPTLWVRLGESPIKPNLGVPVVAVDFDEAGAIAAHVLGLCRAMHGA